MKAKAWKKSSVVHKREDERVVESLEELFHYNFHYKKNSELMKKLELEDVLVCKHSWEVISEEHAKDKWQDYQLRISSKKLGDYCLEASIFAGVDWRIEPQAKLSASIMGPVKPREYISLAECRASRHGRFIGGLRALVLDVMKEVVDSMQYEPDLKQEAELKHKHSHLGMEISVKMPLSKVLEHAYKQVERD